MSYTTAPRPSQTRTRGGARRGSDRGGVRGRGRGRGATANTQITPGTENGEQDTTERIERRDGYSMIAPNERKREKIAQLAKKEEDNYNRYKESRTPKSVSYVGTVGGGLLESSPPGGARGGGRGGRSPATPSKPFGAKTSYKQSVRQKEAEEIAVKKENARKKTEQNKSKEGERQKRLDEDRRMRNEAFLARFETKKSPSNQKEDRQEEDPPGAASSDVANAHSTDGLAQLTQRFPYLDAETLEEMLTAVDGDVEQAITLLSSDD